MPAIEYPSSLPCPQSSAVTPAERRALSDADRPRDARALQLDRLAFERLTWPPLTDAEASVLDAWWRSDLVFGGAWFAAQWPLPQGMVEAVRKFREQPRWQYVPGNFWRMSALCEVRGRGELPRTDCVVEEFAGLGEYTTIAGNGGLFTVVSTVYGNALNIAAAVTGVPARISRTLTERRVSRLTAKFRITALNINDSGFFEFRNNNAQAFLFVPTRDFLFDASRAAHLFIDGNDISVAPVLTVNQWYSLEMTLAAGTLASQIVITNLADLTSVTTEFTSTALKTIDELMFYGDAVSGLTSPVQFTDMEAC